MIPRRAAFSIVAGHMRQVNTILLEQRSSSRRGCGWTEDTFIHLLPPVLGSVALSKHDDSVSFLGGYPGGS